VSSLIAKPKEVDLGLNQKADENEEEEEEEEMPDEWKELDPVSRSRAIIMMSCKMMFIGTAVVLIFSDPMVDVLNQVGIVTGVGSF